MSSNSLRRYRRHPRARRSHRRGDARQACDVRGREHVVKHEDRFGDAHIDNPSHASGCEADRAARGPAPSLALLAAFALGGCFLFKDDDTDPPVDPDGGLGQTCERTTDCAGALVCVAGTCAVEGSVARVVPYRVPLKDLVILAGQLEIYFRLDMVMAEILDAVRIACGNKRMKGLLLGVRNHVATGMGLTAAMNHYPHAFSRFFMGIIDVGEESGKFSGVMMYAQRHLQWMADFRRSVIEQLREEAKAEDALLITLPTGFAFVPVRNGEMIKPDEFHQLPQELRDRYEERITALQKRLQDALLAASSSADEALA